MRHLQRRRSPSPMCAYRRISSAVSVAGLTRASIPACFQGQPAERPRRRGEGGDAGDPQRPFGRLRGDSRQVELPLYRGSYRTSRQEGSICSTEMLDHSTPASSRDRDFSQFRTVKARPAGFEPATRCLEGSRSIRLSYGRSRRPLCTEKVTRRLRASRSVSR